MALMSAELSWLDLQLLEILEYVCISWFTGEFVLRFLCVRDRCRFLRKVPNIIDLLAILPFYITLLVESLSGSHTTQELENVGRIVQVLRLLRALRMLKLGRHSTGIQISLVPCNVPLFISINALTTVQGKQLCIDMQYYQLPYFSQPSSPKRNWEA